MKPLLYIARTLVGSLFVVSGLIKANDTLGFSYKMEEYFDVFGMPELAAVSLPFAFLLAMAEVILGLATLIGARMRILSWILLLMIAFFTWLTFYSAWFDVVKDCGCFGDALKLTPWQSFWKDVVLLVLVLIIFLGRKGTELNDVKANKRILPASIILIGLFSVLMLNWWFPVGFILLALVLALLIQMVMGRERLTEWLQLGGFLVLTGLFACYTLHYLPIRDFRPYAKGKSIPEQMHVPPEDQPVYKTMFLYQNKESGKELKVPDDSLGALSDEWEYKERIGTEVVEEGKAPPISDFEFLGPEGRDLTPELIGDTATDNRTGHVFLVVAYDLHHTEASAFKALNELHRKAKENGHAFFGATKTTGEKVERFTDAQNVQFPFLTADGILLKTIVRSNPGLVLLKDGIVQGKWPSSAIPSYQRIENAYMQE